MQCVVVNYTSNIPEMLKICFFSSRPLFSRVLCEKQCSWLVSLSRAALKIEWSFTSQTPQIFMTECLDTDITSFVTLDEDLIFHGVSP